MLTRPGNEKSDQGLSQKHRRQRIDAEALEKGRLATLLIMMLLALMTNWMAVTQASSFPFSGIDPKHARQKIQWQNLLEKAVP